MTCVMYFLEQPQGKFELTFERKTDGSSGHDLHANIGEAREISPGRRIVVRTGLYIAMPPGMEAQVRPRSGLTRDHGVVAQFGSIDSDYRGEIAVTLMNFGSDAYRVVPGERVAQLVFSPVFIPGATGVPAWLPIEAFTSQNTGGLHVHHPGLFRVTGKEFLPPSDRGASGFGSTGR